MSNQDSTDPDPRHVKLFKLLFWSGVLLFVVLLVGILGFKYIVHLNWIDSFQNASFYISGMGPVAVMQNNEQKLFAGTYAISAGIFYLAIAAYLVSQIAELEFFDI